MAKKRAAKKRPAAKKRSASKRPAAKKRAAPKGPAAKKRTAAKAKGRKASGGTSKRVLPNDEAWRELIETAIERRGQK